MRNLINEPYVKIKDVLKAVKVRVKEEQKKRRGERRK